MLKTFSAGSVGMALQLQAAGGLDFAMHILSQMEQAFMGERKNFLSFASSMSANDDTFALFSQIFLNLLDDIFISLGLGKPASLAISQSLFDAFMPKWSNLDITERKIDYIKNMFAQVGNLNLEKSAIIIASLEVLCAK